MELRLRDVLVRARKAANLRQVDLAKKLGRSQSFVSNYERGQRRVDVVEFILIARELGEEPKEMLGRVDFHQAKDFHPRESDSHN